MASVRDRDLEERVRALVEPLAGDLELVDVEVKGHPGSRVVRIVVDADDGVDVETCAELSRSAGSALDAADAVPGRYTLQVSSPGADRPLRTPRDLTRNLGRTVRVHPRSDADLPRELTGVLESVDDEALTLEVDGDRVEVALGALDHARVVLPW